MRYKDHTDLDKTLVAQNTLDKVTGLMKQNIGKIFENRQELDDIEGKSSNLRDTANRFKMNSAKLERQTRCRNLQMKIMLGVFIAVSIVIIYYLVF